MSELATAAVLELVDELVEDHDDEDDGDKEKFDDEEEEENDCCCTWATVSVEWAFKFDLKLPLVFGPCEGSNLSFKSFRIELVVEEAPNAAMVAFEGVGMKLLDVAFIEAIIDCNGLRFMKQFRLF